ncbi:TcpQ domain-containing protein [Hyphomicrobiales bacterium]|nr:TcpQ domain-containing protein [Hyphomicrobiales bacterium]CAH1702596.1 Toxin co-regulated pilus biosynthesis Q family protein [Hyphomicrobiales bacterium]CAI0346799.1 TcpQ domain-containing protein [Hyphomicrobiales bacterium]
MHPSKRTLRLALLAGFAVLSIPAVAQEAGFGKDIPIGAAARQIVPEGFKVEIADGVDAGAKATWSGGGWRQSLAAAARSAGYAAVISGETVRIVKSAKPVATPATEAAEPSEEPKRIRRATSARQTERHVERRAPRHARVTETIIERESVETVSSSGFVIVSAKPDRGPERDGWKKYESKSSGPAPVAASFVVREGQNLRAVLEDWSGRSGWKLVWNSEYSYALNSSAQFKGTFHEAAHELLRSMAHVRPQVTATFFAGNKTLVVGNELADAAGQ